MKKTFAAKKSAFSLIELSIVLIIIGLLIAGITGGASLIKSSELRSVVVEARVYAAAVNNFYSRFNGLPGDYTVAVAPPATVNGTDSTTDTVGDGDNKIEHYSDAGVAEGIEALRDLKALGAIGDDTLTWVGVASSEIVALTAGTHIPASKIKGAGWAFDYDTTSSQNVVVLTSGVAQTTSSNTVVNGTAKAVGAVIPSDALSIDAKVDDGVANAGKVRGVLSGCSSSAAYTIATSTKACALSYQVDINS